MIVSSKDMKYYFTNPTAYTSIPDIVYHYCSLDTFMSIIENSNIRLSNIKKSNDPTEITYIISVVKKIIVKYLDDYNLLVIDDYKLPISLLESKFEVVFNEYAKNFYIICFSEAKDLLSQWIKYANNGTGVAIGFNTKKFLGLQKEPFTGYIFSEIIYEPNIIKSNIIKFMDREFNNIKECDNDAVKQNLLIDCIDKIISFIFYYSILYKHSSYFEEKEWRLIYNPFKQMKEINDKYKLFDVFLENDDYKVLDSGFERGNMCFIKKGNVISSYFDINFFSIKQDLISEIVLGPKSEIELQDNDLLLFLKINGYDISSIKTNNSILLSKSGIPYK